MSSAKAKKKRQKQRPRLKKKKNRIKEQLKRLDSLTNNWRKLAAAMAGFNDSKVSTRTFWQDGLGLHGDKNALKTLKQHPQPLEPTTNDLNQPQTGTVHSMRNSPHSEAATTPKSRQPLEPLFRARPPPVQKSPSKELSVRTPRTTSGNVRHVTWSSAILVSPDLPTAPTKVSWQPIAHQFLQLSLRFRTIGTVFTPRLIKIPQSWRGPKSIILSFTGVSSSTEQLVVMTPATPAAQLLPFAEPSPPEALQQEADILLPEKGKNKTKNPHKKKRRRHLARYDSWQDKVTRNDMEDELSDSETSDCTGCTSDSSEEDLSDIESNDGNNAVEKYHAKSERSYVTRGCCTIDNVPHNMASLGEETGAGGAFNTMAIPRVLSSRVLKWPDSHTVDASLNRVWDHRG